MNKKERDKAIKVNKAHIKELKEKRRRHASLKPCEISEWLGKLYAEAIAKDAELQGKLMQLTKQQGLL